MIASRAPADVEETWRKLEPTLTLAMNPDVGFSYDTYMDVYTSVYNYCTGTGTKTSRPMPEAVRYNNPGQQCASRGPCAPQPAADHGQRVLTARRGGTCAMRAGQQPRGPTSSAKSRTSGCASF